MRTLLLGLLLVACAPSETLPTACSPACAVGQVCVNAVCLVPADAGSDATPDALGLDVAIDLASIDRGFDVRAQEEPPPGREEDTGADVSGDVGSDVGSDVVADVPGDMGVGAPPDALSCPTGRANCDDDPSNGCEAILASSRSNCGRCLNACAGAMNASGMCVGGTCDIECAMGFADCDRSSSNGCEVNTRGDVRNCGGCGGACSVAHASARCAGGRCAIATCETGFADCNDNPSDGCETNTSTNSTNCGGCDRTCPTGFACADSTCVLSCSSGRILCGGVCIVSRFNANCGACGNVCGDHQFCRSTGVPTPRCEMCPAGPDAIVLTRCGEDERCTDLNADQHHCGTCATDCGLDGLCFNGTCRH